MRRSHTVKQMLLVWIAFDEHDLFGKRNEQYVHKNMFIRAIVTTHEPCVRNIGNNIVILS